MSYVNHASTIAYPKTVRNKLRSSTSDTCWTNAGMFSRKTDGACSTRILRSTLCLRHAENAFPYLNLFEIGQKLPVPYVVDIYFDISDRIISSANGRGLIVSKLPLGICSTIFIALGTAVTIREPRSTRRFSQVDERVMNLVAKL